MLNITMRSDICTTIDNLGDNHFSPLGIGQKQWREKEKEKERE